MKDRAWILTWSVALGACAHSGSGGGTSTAPPTAGEAAVASAGTTSSADEQALRQRVNAWWEAREYRDYRTMYSLFESSLRRRLTVEDYRAQAIPRDRLDLSAHEVRTVTFKDRDHATVRLGYRVRLPQLPEAISSMLDEEWVREKGRWYKVYFVPEPLSPRPGSAPGGPPFEHARPPAVPLPSPSPVG